MKREYLYIAVVLTLSLLGIFYKIIFLSGTIEKNHILIDKNGDLSAKFYRDSLVQANKGRLTELYESNKRGDKSYGEIIAELLNVTENILKKSGIEYKSNDIDQDIDEKKDHKSGISTFYINARFMTEYKNIKDLILSIEKNPVLVNITDLEVRRERVTPDEGLKKQLEASGLEFDEYNEKAKVSVILRLEFIKFL
jgi:hypothetical protein